MKKLFLTILFLAALSGILILPCYADAPGMAVWSLSDAQLYTGAVDVQAASIHIGTTGDQVKLYNGTDATGRALIILNANNLNQDFPVGVKFYRGCYADCSWTNSGWGDPAIILFTK
jgi:hypothetical protein